LEEKLYRMSEAARLLDVHPNTIRRWEATGQLRCEWTSGGEERRVPESEIRRLMGISGNADAVALYGRVSGHGQKDDLDRQIASLKAAFSGRFAETYTYTDIGSGLNPRRKGLWQMLELVRARRIGAVVLTYKDRLTRFGFEYLEVFLEAYGVKILVLYPDDDQTPEQELVGDMVALVTSFAGRLYGRRSHKVKEITKCLKKSVH
jgi:putative resolvase